MDKIDYRVLGSRELISLAKKIESALEESVRADGDDSAYKMVQAEIEGIKKDLSDNPRKLSVSVGEINDEIDRRLSEGRGTVGMAVMEGSEISDIENGSKRFSISLMIVDEERFILDWEPANNKIIRNHSRGFRRQGDGKGFPDQELLKSSPLEWLARYLRRTDLYEEVSEYEDVDYDEGFEEGSDKQDYGSLLMTNESNVENDKHESIDPYEGFFSAGVVCDFLSGNTDADSAALELKEKVREVYKTTDRTEKTKGLIALANEVRTELANRNVQRVMLWHTPANYLMQLNEEKDKYYYLLTTVNDDEIIVDWNAWNGQPVRDVYRKVDGGREISDKELLHENPVEWFAKYLNSGMYRKQDAE